MTFSWLLSTFSPSQLDVYGGLILFCGFVLFDTQLIVERFNNGDNDYVRHSLDLFLDFINIFRRLLVILASKVCLLLWDLDRERGRERREGGRERRRERERGWEEKERKSFTEAAKFMCDPHLVFFTPQEWIK